MLFLLYFVQGPDGAPGPVGPAGNPGDMVSSQLCVSSLALPSFISVNKAEMELK